MCPPERARPPNSVRSLGGHAMKYGHSPEIKRFLFKHRTRGLLGNSVFRRGCVWLWECHGCLECYECIKTTRSCHTQCRVAYSLFQIGVIKHSALKSVEVFAVSLVQQVFFILEYYQFVRGPLLNAQLRAEQRVLSRACLCLLKATCCHVNTSDWRRGKTVLIKLVCQH